MPSTPLEAQILAIIAPAVEAEGFDLVRVRLTGSRSQTIQVMAEKPDRSMSAEDCATLSRALSPILEEADPIMGAYTLEVSSPGIDRPLTRLSDFEEWQGFDAKLELDRLIEGKKRFKGVIAGVDNGKIAFDIEGEAETALFPFEWVANAKLILTDELLKESLKAAKTESQIEETANGDHQ